MIRCRAIQNNKTVRIFGVRSKKSHSMKRLKILIICSLLTATLTSGAQVVYSKIGLFGEAAVGWYGGQEFLGGGEPSLYHYMGRYSGGSAGAVYNIRKFIGVGAYGTIFATYKELFSEGFQQSEPDESPYRGSDLLVRSITPFVQFNYTPVFRGVNRSVAFVVIGPTFGSSYIDLRISQEEATDSFFGITGKIGYEWPVGHQLKLTGALTYQHQFVESALYPDNQFSSVHLGVGMKYNMFRNKRYLYD